MNTREASFDYARLRELAEKATPGERVVSGTLLIADGGATVGQAFGVNFRNDLAFAAAFNPETAKALLDEIEKLQGDVWELEAELKDMYR